MIETVKDFAASAALLVAGGAVSWAVSHRGALQRQGAEAAIERTRKEEALQQRVVELEAKLLLVNERVIPISMAMQALLIKELTHYHTPAMDRLLEKIGPPNTLTPDEEKALIVGLKQRTQDMGAEIGESERDAAVMLPLIMRRVHAEEQLQLASATKVSLVSIPAIIKS